MTRFRLGQRWKREPSAPPLDSIALELDGVNLLPGAVEEPLAEAVPAVVRAAAALYSGNERLAQVSLAEAGLELVLRRAGADVELTVASLGRPARLLRPPVRVDVEEFAEAARECGEGFLAEVSRAAPGALSAPQARELGEALRRLAGPLSLQKEPPPEPFTRRVEASEEPGFGFELRDPADLLRAYARGQGAALGSLLCAGEVWLTLPGQPTAWRASGPPFLTALELSRQAVELARAVELGEPRFAFEPAGVKPGLALELKAERGRLGTGSPFEVRGTALAAAMFHLGQALALALSERERSQAGNPYLVELTERCREGLSHLRGAVQPPEEEGAARGRVPAARTGKPLPVPGRLRRLRFEKRWEQKGLAGAEHSQLHLGRQGPLFCSKELACALSRKDGSVLWRREASHGVAATADGWVVAADLERVYGFVGAGTGARWLHDHDGLPLGPKLLREDGLLITLSEDRTVLAFSEVGGREMWRLAPSRTQRSWLSTQGHRALVTTDSCFLYGLDIATGQLRFRMRTDEQPFHGPAVPWGKRFVAMLGRGSRHALLLADAHTGDVAWTNEFHLSRPSTPLPSRTQLYVAGEREQEGLLLCLDTRGKLLWERALHLGPGPYALASLPGGVIVTSASGSAARVNRDGALSWRVGAAGEHLLKPLPARTSRGVVLIAGEQVRAVDPKGGQVLAEVRAGAGLVALQTDTRLGLYFLDDSGTLSAYRLTSHFTVVEG